MAAIIISCLAICETDIGDAGAIQSCYRQADPRPKDWIVLRWHKPRFTPGAIPLRTGSVANWLPPGVTTRTLSPDLTPALSASCRLIDTGFSGTIDRKTAEAIE
jgi:hypothetical protein